MYMLKSELVEALGENSLKLSKLVSSNPPAIENSLVRLQAGISPIQITSLTAPTAPAGTIVSNLVTFAVDRSRYHEPATADADLVNRVNEGLFLSALPNNDSQFSGRLLDSSAEISTKIVPIFSLSEFVSGSTIQQEFLPTFPAGQTDLIRTGEEGLLDLSLLSPGAPVKIVGLSELGAEVTIINKDQGNVQINDVKLSQASSEVLAYSNLIPLTLETAQVLLSSLSLGEKFELKLAGVEDLSGITVSGDADNSLVNLFIGSSDSLTEGDVSSLVFASGAGELNINLGSGSNTVIIASSDLRGVVNFSTHHNEVADFIAIVANGSVVSEKLGESALVSIAGLNGGPGSSDAIAFLSDMGSQLFWAGGSAQAAQVQNSLNDFNSWAIAAQSHANQAHSVAWFNFEGATYILETRNGADGPRHLDTFVKLTGLYSFTGTDSELTQGMLNL